MANLTNKELTALTEQLIAEQTLIKKYDTMANFCSDTKIQQDLTGFANKHRAHYNTLLTFLQ